jgi:hypothetical protein
VQLQVVAALTLVWMHTTYAWKIVNWLAIHEKFVLLDVLKYMPNASFKTATEAKVYLQDLQTGLILASAQHVV